jgi:hypothetical protein
LLLCGFALNPFASPVGNGIFSGCLRSQNATLIRAAIRSQIVTRSPNRQRQALAQGIRKLEVVNCDFKLIGKRFKVTACDLEQIGPSFDIAICDIKIKGYAVTHCDRIGNGTL